MEELLFPDDSTKDESLTLYKLIVLYMLDKINTPLSNSQISEFMLTNNIAAYFTVQQTINELLESNLTQKEKVLHTTLFTLTKEGEKALKYYKNIIPEDVINRVNEFIDKNKLKIKKNLSVIATYERTLDKKSYNVYCTIKEKDKNIFSMTIEAPDSDIAEKICDNWNKNNEMLYSQIMMDLLK